MVRSRGMSLVETLVVVALVGILVLSAAPAVEHLRTAGRGDAAARHMAALFRRMRMEAVAVRRHRGLWFDRGPRGWRFRVVEDGNGNGLRTAEVRSGADPTRSGPHHLQDVVERVAPGFPGPGPYPAPPPGSGSLSDLDDPVKFGRSDLVSFSPLGRASSGTLYLDDGAGGLWAVVVFGPTTRVRLWRWDPRSRAWRPE